MLIFILSIILVLYFELLGQYILFKLNKNKDIISFPVGLLCFLAFSYITTSIMGYYKVNFAIVALMYTLFFVVSFILIIKDIKNIKFKLSYFYIILFIINIILLWYASNTTLGDLNSFDSTFYINTVVNNASLEPLNSRDVYFNIGTNSSLANYAFQTYYYFASYVIFILNKLLNLELMVSYVWFFQSLFNCFLISLVINTCHKLSKKNYLLLVLSLTVFTFYFGKVYYNNVFGFIGNSYRMIAIGYICYFLYDYFVDNGIYNKILVSIAIVASCSFSSSAVFTVFILAFALVIINAKNDLKIFKWLSVTMIIPSINLLYSLLSGKLLFIILFLILFIEVIVIVYNDKIIYIYNKYKLNIILLIISFLIMFIMSYMVTKNIFDFTAFFDNLSERADMTIDYFDFYSFSYNQNKMWFCLMFFIPFIISSILFRKNKFILMSWILILVLFNPFCCSFINKINIVYYRSYDIILNPFTYILFIYLSLELIKQKYVKSIVTIFAILFLFNKFNYIMPDYYHKTFVPEGNYLKEKKMTQDEYAVIVAIREFMEIDKIENPYIITPNLLTQSFINEGKYLFGRYYTENIFWSKEEKELYNIFYPTLYYENDNPRNADYDNVVEYLKKANIDYLIMSKDQLYYNEETTYWYPYWNIITENLHYPDYENDSFVVFSIKRNLE